MGTPRNGPSPISPDAACAAAFSDRSWITALSSGFTFSMRLIAASTSSDGEAEPCRTRSACAVASIHARSSFICETYAAQRRRGSRLAACRVQVAADLVVADFAEVSVVQTDSDERLGSRWAHDLGGDALERFAAS